MTDEESRKVVYVTIRDVDGDLVGEGDTLEEAWKSIDKQVQAKAFSARPGRYDEHRLCYFNHHDCACNCAR